MKIACISDIHGNYVDVPECDLLIVAGDICPVEGSHEVYEQTTWLSTEFVSYLDAWSENAKRIIFIGGNHDFALDDFNASGIIQYIYNNTGSHIEYLRDNVTTVHTNIVYGSPWVPHLSNWAFYATEQGQEIIFGNIPATTDILITHGPPFGIMDDSRYHFGSKVLRDEVIQRIKPKIHVFGHCHNENGAERIEVIEYDDSYFDEDREWHEGIGNTKFINAAVLDNDYKLIDNPVIEVEI